MKNIMGCLAAILAGACAVQASDVTIHVSPEGNDGNAGSASQPLRSLVGARDAVRRLKAERRANPPRTIEVVFHDGVYPSDAAALFGKEDSAVSGQRIVYRAAKRGAAVFDGGRMLDWQPLDANDPAAKLIPPSVRGRVLTAAVPASQELPEISGGRCWPNLFPAWLYENGKPAPIAAWPDASDDWGDLYREFADADYPKEILAYNSSQSKTMRFVCREKDRVAAWLKEPDLRVYGLWFVLWDDTHTKILEADPTTGVVTVDATTIPKGYTVNWEGHRYRVLNALSEMDKPGEWAIDRARRRIYRVADGSTPVMSAAKELVRADGLSGVTFDGLSFRHARGDVLQFRDCGDVRVRGCTVAACGGWAVKVQGGRDCRVEGCDIHHMGEGGVFLSGGARDTLTRCNHAAVNNHVHHWGERLPMFRSAIAVAHGDEYVGKGYACGVAVEHNLIHHGRHSAICHVGNFNDIRWNMIHDVCACSRDCGAVYCYTDRDWSQSRGTRIEHNCIYKTGQPSPGGLFYVIYVDGFSSGVTVRKNLCIGGDAGLFSQGGHANVIEKNVVAVCTRGAWRCNLGGKGNPFTRADSSLWKAMQRDKALFQSELWASAFPELAEQSKMSDAEQAQSSRAVVYRDNVFAASGTCVWQDSKKLGPYNPVEGNLVEEDDPGFVDFAHCDFNLKPESRAYALVGDLGFDRMGLTNGPDRASAAVRFGKGVTKPPKLEMPSGPASICCFLWYYGSEKFTKDRPLATGLENCEFPSWNPAGNLVAGKSLKLAKDGRWVEYEVAFTPTISATLTFELSGSMVKRTCVDDIRVTGATIQNGGFEGRDGWGAPTSFDKLVDIRQFGVFSSEGPNQAPEGTKFAVVNDDARMAQSLKVEAGKRVTIRCRAAAWRARPSNATTRECGILPLVQRGSGILPLVQRGSGILPLVQRGIPPSCTSGEDAASPVVCICGIPPSCTSGEDAASPVMCICGIPPSCAYVDSPFVFHSFRFCHPQTYDNTNL